MRNLDSNPAKCVPLFHYSPGPVPDGPSKGLSGNRLAYTQVLTGYCNIYRVLLQQVFYLKVSCTQLWQCLLSLVPSGSESPHRQAEVYSGHSHPATKPGDPGNHGGGGHKHWSGGGSLSEVSDRQ